nr:envelope protein 2 variant 315 [Hepacivirus hominis]MOZ58477.1 envelope protein 2 variant 682 [Hepacivirus hominis]MOZ58584.1 envelope protein 2 variant 789 [Hepacivirus hominis]MOZ58591.1 envelope protein 2 variant 796 [Hepacivirus hominis]MOZ58612.1 envelope protein 2 variant 817 [Hepacivirus hominis]
TARTVGGTAGRDISSFAGLFRFGAQQK